MVCLEVADTGNIVATNNLFDPGSGNHPSLVRSFMFEYILIIDSTNTRIKCKTLDEMFIIADGLNESVTYECRYVK